jgi:hypothetical protein
MKDEVTAWSIFFGGGTALAFKMQKSAVKPLCG